MRMTIRYRLNYGMSTTRNQRLWNLFVLRVKILLTRAKKVDTTALRCGEITLRLQSNFLSTFSQFATGFLCVVTELPTRQLREAGKISTFGVHSINSYRQPPSPLEYIHSCDSKRPVCTTSAPASDGFYDLATLGFDHSDPRSTASAWAVRQDISQPIHFSSQTSSVVYGGTTPCGQCEAVVGTFGCYRTAVTLGGTALNSPRFHYLLSPSFMRTTANVRLSFVIVRLSFVTTNKVWRTLHKI